MLHELKLEYPASEVVYRSALQLLPGHTLALERLGRVYLRYRETIPAAVQCFIKVKKIKIFCKEFSISKNAYIYSYHVTIHS